VTLLVPDSLDDLITTTEAAGECGVSISTISNWAARGHLKASGLDERGRPLYKRVDVLRAERDVRRRAIGRNRIP